MNNQTNQNTTECVNNTAAEINSTESEQPLFSGRKYICLFSEDSKSRLERVSRVTDMVGYLAGVVGEMSTDKVINAEHIEALFEYISNDLHSIRNDCYEPGGIFSATDAKAGLEYIRSNR